ncbi:hypothetical protein, partial [Pectinatus frisingensis]
MVIEEKRTVEPIYIENYDEYNFVCKYFPSTGGFEEKSRDEIGGVEFKRGYYVKNKDNLVGLFSSKIGPIIFINSKQYLLELGKSKMDICEKNGNVMVFRLVINDVEIFNIEYEKVKFVNFDPWSDEEMVDFYRWLTNGQNEQKFYDFFT